MKYAIRLFTNPRYGKYTGINKVNKVVLNGTIDVVGHDKWLIDLASLEDASQAFDKQELAGYLNLTRSIVLTLDGFTGTPTTEILASQVWQRTASGVKCPDNGFAVLSLATNKIFVLVHDGQGNSLINDTLTVHGCRAEKNGKNSPDFIAANYDLPQSV